MLKQEKRQLILVQSSFGGQGDMQRRKEIGNPFDLKSTIGRPKNGSLSLFLKKVKVQEKLQMILKG